MLDRDFKLCDSLTPSEICVVVERLTETGLVRQFHKHVPKSRLNESAHAPMLHALFLRFSEVDPDVIVASYFNKTAPTPERPPVTSSYPEAGVLRTYCGTMKVGGVVAWSDRIENRAIFRQND